MSEFKFACPVCGQHMMCDDSHAGAVMECPTCFQKIVAPQAPPAPDARLILTGTKYVAKPLPKPLAGAADRFKSPGHKALPIWLFLIILALLAGGAWYLFRGQLTQFLSGADWQGQDIGAVGATGSFDQAQGIFTVTGSGADIWRRADAFQFVRQSLGGDGSLTARVLNLKNTDEWAKAGVMFRASTNAGSAFALAAIRPDGQAQFIWRQFAGKNAHAAPLAGGRGFPKWVKIVRHRNTFKAFCRASTADAWQPLGSPRQIKMPRHAQIGLVVCAHQAGVLCRAQFDHVTLQIARPGHSE